MSRADFKQLAVETLKGAFAPLSVDAHWDGDGKLVWCLRDLEGRRPIGDETHFDIGEGSSERLFAIVSHVQRRLGDLGYSLEKWCQPKMLSGF